ncbi:MAG: phage minor head protein [Hominimerdicola sp.]
MKTQLPIDELNTLEQYLNAVWLSDNKPIEQEIVDEVLDILILAYAYGTNCTNKQLNSEIIINSDDMKKSIYKKTDNKTFEDRVREYVLSGTVNDVILVADTEAHRIFNEGAFNCANNAQAKNKTWRTMLDNVVRDTHIPLEGITISINSEFVTWDGDRALYPGGFSSAQNNCNCRCFLEFSY